MPNCKLKFYPRRMKSIGVAIISIFCVTVLLIHEASGKGNLARRAERLEELKINAEKGFSIKKYLLETGKYYRWRIISDGRDEYSFVFPKLSRNVWIGQVVIEKKEVKPFGGIYSLEFDEEGEIDVYFLPIRPGKYDFYVENYRESGMLGQIIVK
ncbi:MAG: hypothetical protein VB856_08090 [Rhodospirillales bacterium]|nr:MAG: hypothetical protein CFH07_01595 [Alphaproteobacteria bacterium MarineAlpha3_Bin6]